MDTKTAIREIRMYAKIREDGYEFDEDMEMVDSLLEAAMYLVNQYENLEKAHNSLYIVNHDRAVTPT